MDLADDPGVTATCRSKETYPTPQAAWRELRRIRQRRHTRDLHPYRCVCCRLWHIGRHTDVTGVQ